MNEYHKIQSIFKRDEKTHKFRMGEWSLPEFEYLQHNNWIFTEKIDGTNIRVIWDNFVKETVFKGRTDKAQIYKPLLAKLNELFPLEIMERIFESDICLYGEGYGVHIQGGGGNYIKNDVSFILFDVRVGHWWLKREDIEAIAEELKIKVVPIVASGTLHDAIRLIECSVQSTFGGFLAEGLVCRPAIELKARNGERIITKIKHKDL